MRSFADSDGDGIGDLRGLIGKLDYLNDGNPATTTDLGVTALWLMPVAESPSYHGYDVTDYKAIEKDYGTADDFRALMTAAHARGIDVIVDLVLNHTSIDHPWFQDARTPGSRHDDWYVWSNGPPTFAGPGGQPVWHKDGGRWYYGYFSEGMPDLNLRNPDVTTALDDVARFWLDDLGVDGFRLDAARHLIEDGSQLENTPATFAWLAGFRNRVEQDKPNAVLIGEVWDSTSIASSYVAQRALDMTFEFDLASAYLNAVNLGDPGSLSLAQAEVSAAYPPGGFGAFLTNHDQDRTTDVLHRNAASTRLAGTLLLTGSGVPFIYYGEEIGLRGRKPDEEIRTPMPWNRAGPGYGFTAGEPWEPMAPGIDTTNVATETNDPASLLAHYRALVALRSAHPALSSGELIPVSASPGIYAYLRHAGEESIAVVANLTDQAITAPSLSIAAGPLCGAPRAASLLGAAVQSAPTISPSGGFVGYVPVAHLEAQDALVIRFSP